MKLRMSENSLFAVLLRSPWWISFAIAAANRCAVEGDPARDPDRLRRLRRIARSS